MSEKCDAVTSVSPAARMPNTRVTRSHQRHSKLPTKILMLHDCHDLNSVLGNPIVNRVSFAHASSVAFFDIINSLEQKWVFTEQIKMFEQCIAIIVCLPLAPCRKSITIQFSQIISGERAYLERIPNHPLSVQPLSHQISLLATAQTTRSLPLR